MKFFEKFDGNNILFLVWIVLIISLLYDVEAKGWKFRRKGIEDTRKQIENVEFNFQKNRLNDMTVNMLNQNVEKTNGGDSQS